MYSGGGKTSSQIILRMASSGEPAELLVRKRPRGRRNLPRRIIALPNQDKLWHETWEAGRDPLNFPHPFRGILLGPPGSGKSNAVKNLLLRADPPFTRLMVVHVDPAYTQEYDDVGAELLSEIPDPKDFTGEESLSCWTTSI
jgi:hypothetical protein